MQKNFAISIKPWVLISWFFQTLGILVGSIWAYYELGWGGYWFWDPVENSSLMPWFLMTALFHSILVLERRIGFIFMGNNFKYFNFYHECSWNFSS